jgi:hypothetical protein
MALDVYLQIDGIKGESADSTHQGWIELTSATWGVKQPKSATASTGGGHTAERCEHQTLAVTKLADLASPLLMMYSSMGKRFPKPSWNSCVPMAMGIRSNTMTFWPHAGHRNGLQVDVRAIRLDGKHMGVRLQHEGYDRLATDRLVGIFRTHPSVIKIYFNDTEIHGVWPMIHHDDHFHVELRGGAA